MLLDRVSQYRSRRRDEFQNKGACIVGFGEKSPFESHAMFRLQICARGRVIIIPSDSSSLSVHHAYA